MYVEFVVVLFVAMRVNQISIRVRNVERVCECVDIENERMN